MSVPRTLRVALVLNGGVSLAVWMGGVVREIDAILRACGGGDDEQLQDAHLEAWRMVLLAAGSGQPRKVIVDLVAGTSAGGLNGALLASAIARGGDLSAVKELWMNAAKISDRALVPDESSAETSLLDGKFFHDTIAAALGIVPGATSPESPIKPRGDCTLLVTATALSTGPDDGAEQGEPTDSRRVYRFECRRGLDAARLDGWERNDFDLHGSALALTARASASYPIAFTPVYESEELSSMAVSRPAQRAFLADGGVLDNAPFAPLMDALADLPVEGCFERKVIYVKPSVDSIGQSPELPSSPSIAQTLGRVVTAARQPDQRVASEALDRAKDFMEYRAAAPDRVLLYCFKAPNHQEVGNDSAHLTDLRRRRLVAAAKSLLPQYRLGRSLAMSIDLTPAGSEPVSHPSPEAVAACANISLKPAQNGPVRWGFSTPERVVRWWGRMLNSLPGDGPGTPGELQKAFAEVGNARRACTVARERASCGMRRLPTDAEYDSMAIWWWAACKAVARVIPGRPSAAQLMQASLAMEVVCLVTLWGSEDRTDAPYFTYESITPAAVPLVDIDAAGQQPTWRQSHLYGTRWGHFGAFGHSRWREHDWLWGRLDGASRLLDILLNEKEVSKEDRAKLRQGLARAILDAEGVSLGDVVAGASRVRSADSDSLLGEFISQLDQDTRRAISAQFESLPRQNLPATAATMMLAAMGRTRPEATPGRWWARSKQRLRIAALRVYAWPARRWVYQRVRARVAG